MSGSAISCRPRSTRAATCASARPASPFTRGHAASAAHFTHQEKAIELDCDFVVGCDGSHGTAARDSRGHRHRTKRPYPYACSAFSSRRRRRRRSSATACTTAVSRSSAPRRRPCSGSTCQVRPGRSRRNGPTIAICRSCAAPRDGKDGRRWRVRSSTSGVSSCQQRGAGTHAAWKVILPRRRRRPRGAAHRCQGAQTSPCRMRTTWRPRWPRMRAPVATRRRCSVTLRARWRRIWKVQRFSMWMPRCCIARLSTTVSSIAPSRRARLRHVVGRGRGTLGKLCGLADGRASGMMDR